MKRWKEYVIMNSETVNEIIDYLEMIADEFINKTESDSDSVDYEVVLNDIRLKTFKYFMCDCEEIIEAICEVLKSAAIDAEDEEIKYCFEKYNDCSNHYKKFKETSYKTFLSKKIFQNEMKS